MSWFEDYKRSLAAVRRGKRESVYFLYGSEESLQSYAAEEIETAYRKEAPSPEKYILQGSECSSSDLENTFYALSMFQTGKVIRILEVKELIPSARNMLLKYLKQPDPANCLILTNSKLDRRNKFLGEIEARSTVLYCNEPFPNEIPGWITEYVQGLGKEIDRAAVAKLMELCGTQIDDLRNEIGKLDLYSGDRKNITHRDVLDISAFSRNFTPDDLVLALQKRDRSRAVGIVNHLLEQDEKNDITIIMSVFRVFWLMRAMKGRDKDKVNLEDLARKMNIYGKIAVANIRENHRNYTMKEIDGILEALLEADVHLKSGTRDKTSNIYILMEKILERS